MVRRRKALLFCALVAAPFFSAAAGSSANLTKIVSRDFDVCELRAAASKLCLSQYVDFDGGSITYRGVDIEIYIGGHPNTDGLGILKEPENGILERLYAGKRNRVE